MRTFGKALFVFFLLVPAGSFAAEPTKDGWTPVDLGPPRVDYEWLQNVFVSSPKEVWAFGRDYAYRFDGTAWNSERLDTNAPWTEPYKIVRVGNAFLRAQTQSYHNKVLIQRFRPKEHFWSTIREISVFSGEVHSLWASSEKDIYVSVGYLGEIHHYDGTEWKIVPNVGGGFITGTDSDNVWIASGPYVWRKKGADWKRIGPVDVHKHVSFGIRTVWTDKADHAFVSADYDERPNDRPEPTTMVYEITGEKIERYDLHSTQGVQKFVGTSRENLYAVGGQETQFVRGVWDLDVIPAYGFLMHFDGKTWTEEESGIGKKMGMQKVGINPNRLPGEGGTIFKGEPLIDIAMDASGKEIWGISHLRATRKNPIK